MKRGDLVTIAVGGDYGKPRPALVIQADCFAGLPSVTVLRLSSDIIYADLVRLTVEPSSENGLRHTSQIMIDKAVTVPREKIGKVFGQLSDGAMMAVSRSLIAFFGLEGAIQPPAYAAGPLLRPFSRAAATLAFSTLYPAG